MSQTALQFSIRHAVIVRERVFDDYLNGVEAWLETDPPSEFQADYDAYADEWNDDLHEGALPLVAAATVCVQLGLGWEEVRACARGQLTREQALARRRKPGPGLVDCGPLTGRGGVAAILGQGRTSTTFERMLRDHRFPRPFARFGRDRVWLRVDIEAYRDGTYTGSSAGAALVGEILLSQDLCQRLGLASGSLSAYLCQAPQRVPPPAGRAPARTSG